MFPFSVCMSVYRNDNPEDLCTALNSVIIQSVPPSEVILIVDGPVSHELEKIIRKYEADYSFVHPVWLAENGGLGNALKIAVEKASCEYIARMDSDDISMPDRFKKQLECFEREPDLSIVGGRITEFVDSEDNIVGSRCCPLKDSEIKRYMKSR